MLPYGSWRWPQALKPLEASCSREWSAGGRGSSVGALEHKHRARRASSKARLALISAELRPRLLEQAVRVFTLMPLGLPRASQNTNASTAATPPLGEAP